MNKFLRFYELDNLFYLFIPSKTRYELSLHVIRNLNVFHIFAYVQSSCRKMQKMSFDRSVFYTNRREKSTLQEHPIRFALHLCIPLFQTIVTPSCRKQQCHGKRKKLWFSRQLPSAKKYEIYDNSLFHLFYSLCSLVFSQYVTSSSVLFAIQTLVLRQI